MKKEVLIAIIGSVTTLALAFITAKTTANTAAATTVQDMLPTVKLFEPEHTNYDLTKHLGDYQVCTLITAGASHASQACTCKIQPVENNPEAWELEIALDDNVNGYCNCRAACFNGLAWSGD